MSRCYECDKILIKQYVTNDGNPLSKIELEEYEKYLLEEIRTLECKSCSNLCYTSINDNPSINGIGLCKKCGGKDNVTRPKNFQKIDNYKQFLKIWSCPDHGVFRTY